MERVTAHLYQEGPIVKHEYAYEGAEGMGKPPEIEMHCCNTGDDLGERALASPSAADATVTQGTR